MNITYQSDSPWILHSASEAWNAQEQLLAEHPLCHKLDNIFIGEKFPECPPLSFGEWFVRLGDKSLFLAGSGVSALLNAIEHFFSVLLPQTGIENKAYCHHEKKEYPLKGATLNKESLSAYRIVYQTGENPARTIGQEDLHRHCAARQAAEDLAAFLGEKSGVSLPISPYALGQETDHCIIVGEVLDYPNATQSYGECVMMAKGSTLQIGGRDICGMETGVSRLCKLFEKEKHLTSGDIAFHAHLQKREEYEKNSSAFLPCYGERHSHPEETLSFEKKEEKLKKPNGDVFVLAHRGEHTYYPENSLEANISAYFCGADATELDIHRTRDGVLICMHDDTLTRTTDFSEKKGKNGLPESPQISDWTLSQLRCLCLVDSYGVITPFLIPTLEEILCACNKKIFVHIDKKFDYREEIFPLMRKNQIYDCLYLCNYVDFEGILQLQNDFSDQGRILPGVYRIKQKKLSELREEMDKVLGEKRMTPAVVFLNDYFKYHTAHKKLVREYKGRLRMASWMMWGTDHEFYWREAKDLGFNFLMTNFPIRLKKEIG